MKILKYFLSAAALLVLAAACNHDPEEIVVASSDPVIAPHGSVTVSDATVDETFTLVWSPARFGVAVEVEYAVSAKLGAGEYVALGTTDACNFSLSHAELFGALNIRLVGEYDVVFAVEATAASGAIRAAQPVGVHFIYDKNAYLHLIGSYSDWATGTGAMSRVMQGEDGLFRGFVFFPADGEFKFASQPNWNGTNYGPGEGEGVLSDAGDAKNFSVVAGLYFVTVDIDKLAYTMEPVTVSLALSDHEEKMVYNAADKTWVAFADVKEGDSYTLKFSGAGDLVLGGAEQNLVLNGDALSASSEGIVSFKLSIFDYPYSVAVGEVVEDDKKLYVAHSVNEWNYFEAPALMPLEAGKFYGLMNFIGATSPQVLLARLQSPLGTQYGGADVNKLETFAGGIAATPIAAQAGLRYYAVDLSGDPKVLYDTEVTAAAVLPKGADAPVEMTADGAGKWTLTHDFAKSGKISILLNGGTIECGGTEYPAVLGGSCTGLSLDGAALNMTKGEHTLVLDLSGAVMTLGIDGEIADLQLYPETLGVTGDFGDINWTIAASPQLPGDVETGKYKGYVSMYGLTYGFKFTYGENTWVPGQTVEGADNEFTLGVGDNMMIAEGLYRWDVDLDAMTATATPLTKVGLIGDGVGSWDDDQAELVRDPEDGLYKAAGVVCPGGEFKIRFNGGWDYSLGGTAENLIDNAGNMPIAAGTYDFSLDLTHTPYKLTLTAAE